MNTIRVLLLFSLLLSVIVVSRTLDRAPYQEVLEEKDSQISQEQIGKPPLSLFVIPGSDVRSISDGQIHFQNAFSLAKAAMWYTTLSEQLGLTSAERQSKVLSEVFIFTLENNSSIIVKLHQKDSGETVEGVVTVKNP